MSRDTEATDNSEGTLIHIDANVGQVVEKLTDGLLEEAFGMVGEAFGMGKDWLREQRLRFLTDRLEGAAEMCREAGIENPEKVALSTLAPWIEGASIEEDPALHEMWESLLANAGDPREEGNDSHRSFARLLKDIEAPERKVLEALYQIDSETEETRGVVEVVGVYPGDEQIHDAITRMGFAPPSDDRLQLAKINLTRLGLCSRGGNMIMGGTGAFGGGSNPPEPQEGPSTIHISKFGRAFYEACQPPEP